MKILLANTIFLLIVSAFQVAYSQNSVSKDDLKLIYGDWKGTLSYMDYSTNKPFKMPANVSVVPGKNQYQVKLLFTYPQEPNANSKEKINISKDGLKINKTRVSKRQELEDNEIKIITESRGKDNNKSALIKNIYILGKNRFITRKKVKFDNSEEWIVRNEYNFER